ncbi:hypothetical protein BaRGS_00025148 [Batillaria attramentaria]|uniref:Uncharacterized protein n=1 Tax=Batillaria attramentaria TaxID=370345 RepID=A0ABD0K919_9CAEN
MSHTNVTSLPNTANTPKKFFKSRVFYELFLASCLVMIATLSRKFVFLSQWWYCKIRDWFSIGKSQDIMTKDVIFLLPSTRKQKIEAGGRWGRGEWRKGRQLPSHQTNKYNPKVILTRPVFVYQSKLELDAYLL